MAVFAGGYSGMTRSDHARDVARRYGKEFVTLKGFRIPGESAEEGSGGIDLSLQHCAAGRDAGWAAGHRNRRSKSAPMMIDEIRLLLNRRIVTKVSSLRQINEVLNQTGESQTRRIRVKEWQWQKRTLFANGVASGPISPTGNPITDLERAQDVARRYRCEFIDLTDFELHHELFKKDPGRADVSLQLLVPLEETVDGRLAIAIADPSQLMMIDEISLLLKQRIVTKVSTLKQISDILKKTEQSQRVLEEASEGFQIIREDENTGAEETLSIDKLTATGDTSPIIRLVDTTIFTALQRRASDIHIETRDDSVVIKFRIDGVLTQAMPPIGKEHHSTVISRIKVMSELDISERRVPQDGRFRVKYNGRAIDFRVSIMPVDPRRRRGAPRT